MYEGKTLKEIQDSMRSQKVKEFGCVRQKTECVNCIPTAVGYTCHILRNLYCKSEVCHFYDKG